MSLTSTNTAPRPNRTVTTQIPAHRIVANNNNRVGNPTTKAPSNPQRVPSTSRTIARYTGSSIATHSANVRLTSNTKTDPLDIHAFSELLLSLKSEFRDLKVAYENVNKESASKTASNPNADALNLLKDRINQQTKLNEDRNRNFDQQIQQLNIEYNVLKDQLHDRGSTLKNIKEGLLKQNIEIQNQNALNSNLLFEKKLKTQEARSDMLRIMDQLNEERNRMIFSYHAKVKHSKHETENFTSLILQDENKIRSLENELSQVQAKIVNLDENAKKDERKRRELFACIQHLKGNARVVVRLRRLKEEESGALERFAYSQLDEQELVVHEEEKSKKGPSTYRVDRVYALEADNEEISKEMTFMVDESISGKHTICLVYGQSGSGKEETLFGDAEKMDSRGVIEIVAEYLLKKIEKKKMNGFSIDVKLNFIRISNEEIYDLLNKDKKIDIEVAEKPRDQPNNDYASFTSSVSQYCENKRMIPGEQLNESHCLFRFHISQLNLKTKETLNSVFTILQFAGSEYNFNGTNVEDKSKVFLNPKILPFANVITALANGEKNVPYKASKLTQILSNEISTAALLLCAHISPANNHFKDTLNTLRFAAKFTTIEISRKSNKENKH